MVSVEVPAEYGYVVLVSVASAFMVYWKAFKVHKIIFIAVFITN